MEEQVNTPAVQNGEKRYNLAGTDGKFLRGNPGRPKGAKNQATRIREQILACMGRKAFKRLKQRLNGCSSPRDFEKALDQVIAVLGPGKPLVAIDQSKHTHFTVILDGSDAGSPTEGSPAHS